MYIQNYINFEKFYILYQSIIMYTNYLLLSMLVYCQVLYSVHPTIIQVLSN